MNIVAIYYSRSGSRSFRGCEVERWESDFDIQDFTSVDDAAEWAASLQYSQEGIFHLIIDGVHERNYSIEQEHLNNLFYKKVSDKVTKLHELDKIEKEKIEKEKNALVEKTQYQKYLELKERFEKTEKQI